ncbi:flavin reductase family protein [Erythrobacter sp. NFXS35]|uniref:flavin reductase family protein n=1 Tax=Erythrobacter sp. NFXS35 TaxID=2818436 RepID=UPI0032DF5C3D
MPDSLNPADFRQLMGQFATGVAVVSVLTEADGAEVGDVAAMTINSLVSVSLDPMLVCWNLQNSSSQFALYAGAERFAISILAEGQQSLARRYAARGSSALSPADFQTGPDGLPVIAGALGHVACRRFAAHEAGDHTLILGQVEGMAQAASPLRPLVFFGGRFEEIAL